MEYVTDTYKINTFLRISADDLYIHIFIILWLCDYIIIFILFIIYDLYISPELKLLLFDSLSCYVSAIRMTSCALRILSRAIRILSAFLIKSNLEIIALTKTRRIFQTFQRRVRSVRIDIKNNDVTAQLNHLSRSNKRPLLCIYR